MQMKQNRVEALSQIEKDTAQAACRKQKLAPLNNIESKLRKEKTWRAVLAAFGGFWRDPGELLCIIYWIFGGFGVQAGAWEGGTRKAPGMHLLGSTDEKVIDIYKLSP